MTPDSNITSLGPNITDSKLFVLHLHSRLPLLPKGGPFLSLFNGPSLSQAIKPDDSLSLIQAGHQHFNLQHAAHTRLNPPLHHHQAPAPSDGIIMSSRPQQQCGTPVRPAFTPIQSTASSHSMSYGSSAYSSTTSSSTTMSTRSSTAASAPPTSPSTSPQQQSMLGSLNQQNQHTQQPRQRPQAQRHPSFEYQPNRSGAGQTAGETTNFLAQTSLLAEAAKRAQMACVMRDLDGMEL